MTDTELESRLGELLAEAAAGYRLPPDGIERIRATVRADQPPAAVSVRRARAVRWRRPLTAAAAVAVLVGGVLAIGLTVGPRTGGAGGAGSASVAIGTGHIAGGLRAPAAGTAALPPGTKRVAGTPGAPTTHYSPGSVGAAKVVKTGTIALQVGRSQVGAVLARVQDLAAGLGGYVASATSQQAGSSPSGVVTLRVPVDRFQTAVDQARGLGRVLTATTTGQDVTGSYVDLGAQIAALRVSRNTYLTIESKATTIGEILAVQQQIDAVTQQLQELEGQQKLLADQAAFSSLTVSVQTRATVVPPPAHEATLLRALHQAGAGFLAGLAVLVAATGPLALALLCLLIAGALARLGWRRLRRDLV